MDNDATISSRQIEAESNLPSLNHVKAWKVLKNAGLRPYKIHISHALREGDAERRLTFCNWLLDQDNQNRNFLSNILWTDEATFTNCGVFNRNNEHIWARENPRENREVRKQVRFSLNVWAGILGDRIFGPVFLPQRLTGEYYLVFLNNTLQDFLSEIPLARLQQIWFQQDGAAAHGTRDVTTFLHAEFPGRWIGNRGFIEWPARSPDLTPLDFFFWGAIKNKVYKQPINVIEELRVRCINAFVSIRRRSVHRATQKVRVKIEKCINQNGNLFEHLR